MDRLRAAFATLSSAAPRLFRAPGRVNLIGEHTDYNGGFVMPAALGFSSYAAIGPRDDGQLVVHSVNFGETVDVPAAALAPDATPRDASATAHWTDYVIGVIRVLREAGVPFRGANLALLGEVPLGSGLSSSAALELCVALAVCDLAARSLPGPRLAELCQRAENIHVGMRCGIMDQFISACGKAGHALLLDCRSLDYRLLPLVQVRAATPTRLVVCNTMVRHELSGGEYNIRRAQCEAGVQALAVVDPAVRSLRDATPALLERAAASMDPLVLRRCRHVVHENVRVLAAAEALESGDLVRFGALMRDSHRSLRDDYEVSCDELDLMVRLADGVEGVFGARMTGGGFGGCTVNLVREDAVPRFRETVAAGYHAATGHRPEIHVCEAADGAGPLA